MGVVMAAQLLMAGTAAAASRTWTGSGSDNNMTTAANWGGTAPVAGDDLDFPTGTGVTQTTVNNDFTAGTSFNSITFSGTYDSDSSNWYTINGNAMTLDAGVNASTTGAPGGAMLTSLINVNLTLTADQAFNADGNNYLDIASVNVSSRSLLTSGDGDVLIESLAGTGSLTSSSNTLYLLGANTGYSGAITVTSGVLNVNSPASLGSSSGVASQNGSELVLGVCGTSTTYPQNLSLAGVSASATDLFPSAKLYLESNCGGFGSGVTESYGWFTYDGAATLTGAISLGSDVTFGAGVTTTTLTGAITGAYHINVLPGWGGKLVVNSSANGSGTINGTYTSGLFIKNLSDSQPSNSVNIFNNTEITIDGTRGIVDVNGGKLKGHGTVGQLFLYDGSIDPGDSPGILNTGDLTFQSGALDEELGGTGSGQFDQLNVTGTVDLGTNTVLNVSLVNSFKPVAGNSFIIVRNDGTDPVTGSFKNLAEGATFTASGYVFKISYVGGDGNDVVLTVLSVPSAPNTGLFGLNLPNAWLVLLASLISAASLFFLAYRRAGAIG
jgi:hypothetical protein